MFLVCILKCSSVSLENKCTNNVSTYSLLIRVQFRLGTCWNREFRSLVGHGCCLFLLYTVVEWLWNWLIPHVGRPTTCLKDSSWDNFVRSE
jgi:hypothetical protein